MGFFKKIKNKIRKYKIKGENNKIYIIKDGIKKEHHHIIQGLNVVINGNNNKITIEGDINFLASTIVISNSDKEIYIKNTPYEIHNLYIEMVQPCKDQKVFIDKNVSINGASFYIYGNDATLEIGEDCMFSSGIVVMTSDGHKLIKKSSNKILNNENNIVKIGKHVWVCRGVTICKGVTIPDNCVVGTKSLVTNIFDEEYVAIAGVPAKIIKRDIIWEREENF